MVKDRPHCPFPAMAARTPDAQRDHWVTHGDATTLHYPGDDSTHALHRSVATESEGLFHAATRLCRYPTRQNRLADAKS